jgi:hypothetical protein
VEAAGLDPARLAERLACDDQGVPLNVELNVPGWANRLPAQSLPGELVRHVRDYERARLGTDFQHWLSQNQARLAPDAEKALSDALARLARQAGLPSAEAFVGGVLAWLDARVSSLSAQQAEGEGRLVGLVRELDHLESAFLRAGEGIFLGRGMRVARAQRAYLAVARRLYTLRWRAQVAASVLALLNRLGRAARDGLAACRETARRLGAAHRALRQAGSLERVAGLKPPGVTSHTLADDVLVAVLFERHAPLVSDTLAVLFSTDASPLDWRDAPPERVQAALLEACQVAFEPIAGMSVEAAIALHADDATHEGYYRWLMEQATPSWNLDRTRLPDGGASLKRLEVLGVPDEADSLYRHHATALVSTNDPTRLIAFVACLGAAHSALQQWDNDQAAYDRARSIRGLPLHILPQFQTGDERARQAFALASLFGFIRSHGSYFYYIPADNLERPVKLAQGLANALHAFINHDGWVREAWERVEQVVASRGVEAILRVLTAYYNAADDGRDSADDLVLELKRLVRAYADELGQIHQFIPALGSLGGAVEQDGER